MNLNQTIPYRKDYNLIVLSITSILIILPSLIFSENDIANNKTIVNALNLISPLFTNIENMAIVSSTVGLYFKSKFLFTYTIFVNLIVFIVMLYIYARTYLSSLGKLERGHDFFFSENIQKNKTDTSKPMLFASILIIVILINFFYFDTIMAIQDHDSLKMAIKKEI
ncbi:hypothetical protein [Arcobacter roscoffensis]|uniref:Uncharacterized protein n=1 Tax=Arcobacter roscoffensis TaxID=2961520 RepID=A0ABY5E7X9_9BACT|nr:hypothetical protein [Arcobacter roscoffensis]UTJ07258.1 hypothetical protein NJU99_03980 [Arcobacter roscoffensis]